MGGGWGSCTTGRVGGSCMQMLKLVLQYACEYLASKTGGVAVDSTFVKLFASNK